MRVHFVSDRSNYVIREPMVFDITLTNETDQTIRIPDPTEFDNNMKHFFIEVAGPTGETRFRRSQFKWATVLVSPTYQGEPLAPGDSITTSVYPVASFDVDVASNSVVSGTFGLTFPKAGSYRVRVHYWDDMNHPLLWRSGSGSTPSNTISIEINEPTPDEKVLLDAIWAKGAPPLQMGDDQGATSDEDALRSAIAEYPKSHLAPLAKFYLARSLSSIRDWNSPMEEAHRESVAMLRDLRAMQPRLRAKETLLNLAVAHIRLNEDAQAVQVLNEALRERPELYDSYAAMKLRFMAGRDPNASVSGWMAARMRGEKYTYEP